MGLLRPHSFAEIKGQDYLVEYFTDHIQHKSLPHFLILHGPEGIGKTAFAETIALSLEYGLEETPERKKAAIELIDNKHDVDGIKRYALSVEGGKDVAKQMVDEMRTNMTNRVKVLIADEAHGLSDAAQDVFLVDTEYMRDDIYLIMLTTEMTNLKPTLISRAVTIPMMPLNLKSMVSVLKDEVKRRDLKIQGQDEMLTLIALWAECKPRLGLNMLSAFRSNSAISASTMKQFIGYMEVKDVLPIVTCLNDSMSFGLEVITGLKVSNSIVDIFIEILRVKLGVSSYKLTPDEARLVRQSIETVPEENLIKFVTEVTSTANLTKNTLIHAFLSAHVNSNKLMKSDTSEVLDIELGQKATRPLPIEEQRHTSVTPTIDSILMNARRIE